MNVPRASRSTYVAAFLLGALIAVIVAAPARSAEPFRLDRIGIVRFTESGDNKLRRQHGVLLVEGRVQWRASTEIIRPEHTPTWALGRYLVSVQAWHSYLQLGTGALENFELTGGAVQFAIGGEWFYTVAPNLLAAVATGQVINLSTRTRVGLAPDEVIAGFIIEERPRTVLIRAVGPGLARFGVAQPAPNPLLRVKHNGETLLTNDDWFESTAAAEISWATTRVGAFPLDARSLDAACVVVLPPGAYTVHVSAASLYVPGGEVLLEIYSVPDEPMDLPAARP